TPSRKPRKNAVPHLLSLPSDMSCLPSFTQRGPSPLACATLRASILLRVAWQAEPPPRTPSRRHGDDRRPRGVASPPEDSAAPPPPAPAARPSARPRAASASAGA